MLWTSRLVFIFKRLSVPDKIFSCFSMSIMFKQSAISPSATASTVSLYCKQLVTIMERNIYWRVVFMSHKVLLNFQKILSQLFNVAEYLICIFLDCKRIASKLSWYMYCTHVTNYAIKARHLLFSWTIFTPYQAKYVLKETMKFLWSIQTTSNGIVGPWNSENLSMK